MILHYFLLVGGYCYDMIVENNTPKLSGKVIIPNTIVHKFSFEDPNKVGTLVHEICHMVKSGLNISTNKNVVTRHIGLD